MLIVSDKYKAAVTDNRRKSKVRCVLTLASGDVVNLSDSDIIKDTLYVTNQSTNNSDFEYGCVYCGECGFSFRKDIDRYKLYDAKVQPYWSLQLDDGTWEEIPLGVFYVSESSRVNDKLNIKALDGMTLCDVNVADNTTGAPYDLLAFAAEKCGFDVSQTQEEVEALANGTQLLALYADRVDTYRDLVAYLGMMTASFATFDRYGKLKLVPYSTAADVTLDKKQRFMDASFSDYQTSFIGVEARFIANENYAPYEEYVEGTGLILDLGDIPIMQGLPEDKHLVMQNILSVLKDVKYTPCEIQIAPNPAIELGDMVSNVNAGKDGAGYTSLVTYSYWSYRGKHKLKSIGGNPKLNGISSKQYKQLKDMEAVIDAKSVNVASYTNAKAYEFSTTEQEIILIQYSTVEETTPIFLATVSFALSLDGEVTFRFYIDSLLDESRTVTGFYERGNHIVTLSDYFEDDAATRKTVIVTAQVSCFESDNRQQQANIITNLNFLTAIDEQGATVEPVPEPEPTETGTTTEPTTEPTTDTTPIGIVVFPEYAKGTIDTTVATCSIAVGKVKAAIFAQGLGGNGAWDGTLDLSDYMQGGLVFGSLGIGTITDSVASEFKTPTPIIAADSVGSMTFGSLAIGEILDAVVISHARDSLRFATDEDLANYTYDSNLVDTDGSFKMQTQWNFDAVEVEIEQGRMETVNIITDGIDAEVVVING